MTQQGIVIKKLPNSLAEIMVTRTSACGHDCAKCGGCGGAETQTLQVTAQNPLDAEVGERVLIEGETGRMLSIAGLVYIVPLVLFFVGCILGGLLGLGEGGMVLLGGIGFALGIVCGIVYGKMVKKRNEVMLTVVRRLS